MNKAISCKKHPKCFIQWIRILEGGIDFGCIKCQDDITDRSHILYLPEVIENPEIIIPHLPIDEFYKTFYNNLIQFSEEELEKTYLPLENSLKYLYELLKNLIENGRANIEEFKKKCKESRQQLYQQFKIQEISSLIQQFEIQQNQDAQDQIQKKLIDISEKVNEDVMKKQSNIKKLFNESSLAIYKLNLYCNKQINEISIQIHNNTNLLKIYFNQSFINRFINKQIIYPFSQEQSLNSFGIVMTSSCNFQLQANFPYYLSRILPQYYFDYILKQIDFQEKRNGFNQDKQLRAYFMFEPTSQEIVNGKQFWKVEHQFEDKGKLIIFKSNNNGNPIFGYFKSSGAEFIFSYTHNEIYPKKKQLEQNEQQNIGSFFQVEKPTFGLFERAKPTFVSLFEVEKSTFGSLFKVAQPTSTVLGRAADPANSLPIQMVLGESFMVGNYDLQIDSNLIDGTSMLGQEFIWDSQKNGIEQTEYLFGGAKPNIQLGEVFCF